MRVRNLFVDLGRVLDDWELTADSVSDELISDVADMPYAAAIAWPRLIRRGLFLSAPWRHTHFGTSVLDALYDLDPLGDPHG